MKQIITNIINAALFVAAVIGMASTSLLAQETVADVLFRAVLTFAAFAVFVHSGAALAERLISHLPDEEC